jgi:hypothetical protein
MSEAVLVSLESLFMRDLEEIYRMSPAEEDGDLISLIGTIAVRWATLDATLVTVLGYLL